MLTLAAVPTAVGCSRLLARHTLIDRQLDQRSASAVEQATCELVAHAVATTGITDPLPIYDSAFDNLTLITVRLTIEPGHAVIEVWDTGTTQPAAQLGQSAIIANSLDWGYDTPFHGQRVLWCRLSIRAQAREDQTIFLPKVVLPRRVPRHVPGEPVRALCDLEILRRVRDGLQRLDADQREDSGGDSSP